MKEIKSLKDIPTQQLLKGGSPTCAGCGPEIGLKLALKVLGKDTVVINPSGCMTLLCNYPFTPLKVSWIHNAIENAPATAIGISAALRARNRKMNLLCYAGDGACYSDDTEILSNSGFKLIKDLKIGEKVWSVNPDSNELELQEVEKLHKYKFNGKMVGVKSRYLDYLVTPNHKVPIWKNNQWEFIEAKELKKRYKTKTLRKFKWNGKNPDNYYKLPKFKVRTSEKQIEKVPIKEWLQFLGWFIAEGSLYHSKSGYLVRVYQSDGKNKKEILKITEKLGFNSFECNRSVDISSKQLYRYLERNCGKGFADKKIPRWVLSLDKKSLMYIFETLMKGDGSVSFSKGRKKPRSTYTTKSRQLSSDFIELVIKLGWNCNISKDRREIYRIGIDKQHLEHIIYSYRKDLNLKQVYEERYNGFVYCPQLPENHTVIIKRKGKISLNGNSYDIGFGSLSFMAMRNDHVIYICYNNECYGNTGNQWDTSTPYLASTTTTPIGEKSRGNPWNKKDMVRIMAVHGVYSATANLAFPLDYISKIQKAVKNPGMSYIELMGTCPTNWHADPSKTIEISKLAVETAFWPLIEREKGKLTVNYKPEQLKPVLDYLKTQGRFSHLTKREAEDIQEMTARRWVSLLEEEKNGK